MFKKNKNIARHNHQVNTRLIAEKKTLNLNCLIKHKLVAMQHRISTFLKHN